MRKYLTFVVILCLVFCFSCKSEPAGTEESAVEEAAESAAPETAEETAPVEVPDFVTVQHILIAFDGAGIPNITRSLEEAEKLAREIMDRALAGEDFDALVKEYTNDAHPGIYKMANLEENSDMEKGIYFRGGMVKAFGDVGFGLKVGEIGMTEYSPEESKYGYHIIKRLE